jgi:pseudouridine synthase
MTNEGDLAHALQHPSGEVEREYRVEAKGKIEQSTLARLTRGVELEDGVARAKAARLLRAGPTISHVTVILTEGRKREVRRMMAEVGHPVLKLRRMRFGTILLGDLDPGAWRELTPDERADLAGLVGR